jgi:hypothetical protein
MKPPSDDLQIIGLKDGERKLRTADPCINAVVAGLERNRTAWES